MKKIYRQKYDFGDANKYHDFLTQNLLKLNPRYYSVCCYRRIDTPDGPMYAIKIVMDGINDPTLEPIAECWINNQYIYLWRDQCWTIANNDKGNPIVEMKMYCLDETIAPRSSKEIKFTIAPRPRDKTMVIHKIGTDPI